MEARPGLTPAQLHILEMMSYCKTEQSLSELKSLLQQYYAKQAQKEADRLSEEGPLSNDSIDSILKEHLRTPYSQR